MSSSINVSYHKGNPTGNITISQNASNSINISTNDFLELTNIQNIKQSTVGQNKNDIHFTTLQKYLRYLDCLKDAKLGTNVSNAVSIIYDDDFNLTFETLNVLEDKFNTYTNQIRQKYSWTKKTKDSTLEPLLENRYVFKESGLNPEYYIKGPVKYVGNIATEVIDPAGRSPIETKDIKFPEKNITLKLDEKFMGFFGFDNCSVEATRISNSKYNYTIKIGSIVRTTSGGTQQVNQNLPPPSLLYKRNRSKSKLPSPPTLTKRKRTTSKKNSINLVPILPPPPPPSLPNINNDIIIISDKNTFDWFPGNKKKNILISKSSLTKTNKRALFIAKEMGDVLQVLIMFIWYKLNQTQSYCITTCDNVVFLLCMILQLNCILTYGEKATKTTKKMRVIDVFEPSGNTPEKAFARFESTKKSILTHNEKFIKCLQILKLKQANIELRAITNTFKIPTSIYDKFIDDLNKINLILKKQTVNPKQSASITDDFTKAIKVNFTFIEFIRISKERNVSITMHSTYTSNNLLWEQFINPSKEKYIYKKTTFYNLIINPSLINPIVIPIQVKKASPTTTPTPTTAIPMAVKKASPTTTPTSTTAIPMEMKKVSPTTTPTPTSAIPMRVDSRSLIAATPLSNAISMDIDEMLYPPIMIELNESDLENALKIDLGEPIEEDWYNIYNSKLTGGTHKSETDEEFLKKISYIEYPDTAIYYDKDENKEYNLYDELTTQINKYLQKINKTVFYDHVYTNLLHYFYLTNEVLYDNQLKTIISKMFDVKKRRITQKAKSEPVIFLPLKNKPLLYNSIENISIEPMQKINATSKKNKNNRNIGKLLNTKSGFF